MPGSRRICPFAFLVRIRNEPTSLRRGVFPTHGLIADFRKIRGAEALGFVRRSEFEAQEFLPIQFDILFCCHGREVIKSATIPSTSKFLCMINFFITRPFQFTLWDVEASKIRQRVRLINYESALAAQRFEKGTYIFGDLDRLHYRDREEAARLYRFLKNEGCRVLNDPARVPSRLALLVALHREGLNGFNAFRATELPASMRFPVFVRNRHEHNRPISDLLSTAEEVASTIADAVCRGTPAEHLIVIEYAAEEFAPGRFRKMAAFRIGERIIPYTVVHDQKWLVKSGILGGGREEDYCFEASVIAENPHREVLQQAFEVAGIEYGRADYGMCGGQVQIYEINTNPHVCRPGKHPSAQRMLNQEANWEAYLQGLLAVDSPRGRITAAFPKRKRAVRPKYALHKWFLALKKKRLRS